MPLPVGLHYCLSEGKYKPVILKSHAIKVYMKRDGMTYEEAIEMWEYNMAGSDSILIAVDDMLPQPDISRILYGEENMDMSETEDSAKEAAKIQGFSLEEDELNCDFSFDEE